MANSSNKNTNVNHTAFALFVVLLAVVLRDIVTGMISPVWIALLVVTSLITIMVLVLRLTAKDTNITSSRHEAGRDG